MTTHDYLSTVSKRFKQGYSSEHSYRGDLEALLRALLPKTDITNEPSNVTDCGNPDFVLMERGIPVGFIEAKDVGRDLDSKTYREQFGRYRRALDNLIITDYLRFQFFQDDELIDEVRIGEIRDDQIHPLPENISRFEERILNFKGFRGQTIKSAQKLAKMMAAKARLLQDTMHRATDHDVEHDLNTELRNQYDTFKKVLIHDLTPKAFADLYAQTVAYGMFAARLHDDTLEDFSRQEAAELIPKTNPFLRKLFQYIAAIDIDPRIKNTVDNLADVYRATDVRALLKDFGKTTGQHDPIIHFYETFLSELDPSLRKSRGVWYTPESVVTFIVRAVDDLLKTEFGLKDGLADTSKTRVNVKRTSHDKRRKGRLVDMEEEMHKVQILDPATGTGTFLAEVVKHIYHAKFKAMQGVWSSYVENDLIPRINGFEILMASYAMAHLKLGMILDETGYTPQQQKRFRVYLTNTLEEFHKDTGTLFSSWLSDEASEANHVKRDTPVMVVLGNPPYSGISSNMGDWINNLIEDYKYVDGKHFGERKHWLHDDYVKFIRYGQYLVEKNGEGIVAYINPHGFLDNPTFRGMRWQLLKAFDTIYTIDLHGNSKKKETAPDGSKDENVFDIQQGVSINLFVKTGRKAEGELGQVRHLDLYGQRDAKYDQLETARLADLSFTEVEFTEPYFFFTPKEEKGRGAYEAGFSIDDVFPVSSTGIVSMGDGFIIGFTQEEIESNLNEFLTSELTEAALKSKFNLGKNYAAWILGNKREVSQLKLSPVSISYRPFDERYTYFDNRLLWRWRDESMRHLLHEENVGLVFARQSTDDNWTGIQMSTSMIDNRYHFSYKGIPQQAPLYLYSEADGQQRIEELRRTPNLDEDIIQDIATRLGLTFIAEKEDTPGTFAPIDLLDYIYAVLHSPSYRETYAEFLKIDFPRVPYPEDPEDFWKLVELGSEIRRIHLLEHPIVEDPITTYPHPGSNQVANRIRKSDWEVYGDDLVRVWINEDQCFEGIPLRAWEFYIGGYQPAQKWLKDRSPANRNLDEGRVLTYDDIRHYQKIIVALNETARLMEEVDGVVAFGG